MKSKKWMLSTISNKIKIKLSLQIKTMISIKWINNFMNNYNHLQTGCRQLYKKEINQLKDIMRMKKYGRKRISKTKKIINN